MRIPVETKPAIWGIAGGAIAMAFVGFNWGGWVTGGKAESVASQRAKDAVVVAQGAVVPHLSNRDRLFVLDAAAPDADFVVATDRLDPWPLGSVDELRALVDARRRQGYQPVFERDGWVVLRRH